MRNIKEMWLAGALGLALAPMTLCTTGGCSVEPALTTTEQGVITSTDLFTALDVPASGPNNKTIGIVEIGGYPNLSADLQTYRTSTLGVASVTALTEMDENGGTSFPAFQLAGAQDAAAMIQAASITGTPARFKVAHADSAADADIAKAIDALRTSGVDTLGGVSQLASAPNTTTALRAAATAGIQIVWSTGVVASGNGFTTGAPLPWSIQDATGHDIVIPVATTTLATAMNSRGYSETLLTQSVTGSTKGAGASMPGNGPLRQPSSSSSSSNVNVTGNPAFSVGLALGAFYRHLAWKKPADLVAADFFDLTAGNDGSCSPTTLCTAASGADNVSGVGTPDVAKF